MSKEELVRYCPGCGSVGQVEAEFRDCCPDGGEARMIPRALAEKCRVTFKIAVEKIVAADDCNIREDAEGLTLRAGSILWLDAMLAHWDGDSLNGSGLDELIEYDLDSDHLDDSMEPFRSLLELDEDEEDDYEHILCSQLGEKFERGEIKGFILVAQQPIFISANETSQSYSWGSYRYRHFMAPTLEQAWSLAKHWARQNLEKAKADTLAKKAVK